MIDLQNTRINTAGAYVCIDGLYLFAIGIKPHNSHIPIVRLGGHREGQETGWQCAVREVYEEANLHIQPLVPQTTYVSDWDHKEIDDKPGIFIDREPTHEQIKPRPNRKKLQNKKGQAKNRRHFPGVDPFSPYHLKNS